MKKKFWNLGPRAVSNLLIVLIGILFYVMLDNFDAVRLRFGMLLGVGKPFIIGFAIAYLLNTPVHFFECKVFHKIRCKRGLSITTVYLLAVLVVTILMSMILPQVVSSIMTLVNNIDSYLKNLNALVDDLTARFGLEGDGLENLMVSYEDLMKEASHLAAEALPQLAKFGMSVGSGVVAAVTALISSVYMLSGKNTLTKQLKGFLYAVFPIKKVDHFLHICRHANEIFVGFINAKIIDSCIIGVLCFILCCILRIPYAVLFSVVIGVTNIIPFFGPLIGAIPSVMILIVVEPWAALRFGVMIIVLQQFDGNILGPKILGDSTGLSAIWVLAAIVVGGGLFGFPGMVLGVPTFAVIYMLTRDFVIARLKKKQIDQDGQSLLPGGEESPPENEKK